MDKILFIISLSLSALISIEIADLYFSERELENPVKFLAFKRLLVIYLISIPLGFIVIAPYSPMMIHWLNSQTFLQSLLFMATLMFVDLLVTIIMCVVARLSKKKEVLKVV